MIFNSKYPNLRVWDSQNDKLLCEFSGGTYETDSQYEIEILKKVEEVTYSKPESKKSKK